jgi:pectate lyase
MSAGEIKAKMTDDFPTWQEYQTAIEAVKVAKQNVSDAIYNLAGQRVDSAYKGLVIKNGVKSLQK